MQEHEGQVEDRVKEGIAAAKVRKQRVLKDELARQEMAERHVVLRGVAPIMFDRYPGNNNTQLKWWEKVYLDSDGETICMPALNIMSFLSARNTTSAPKRLMDPRKYMAVCNACLSFVVIDPLMIPFVKNGEQVKLGAIVKDRDPRSGLQLHISVARLDKGVPNPKERPVLPMPWSLDFNLTILPNSEIQEQQIRFLFEAGGRALGLGTFRGVFGKFIVEKWDAVPAQ